MLTLYKQLLQQNSLSNTRPRQLVFETLLATHHPLTIAELVESCAVIDRVSVYRIVDVFEKIGVINRLQIGWKYKLELGDQFKSHHHHLSCISCGSVEEFEEPASLDIELNQISSNNHFKVTQHTLELRGFCRNCQEK